MPSHIKKGLRANNLLFLVAFVTLITLTGCKPMSTHKAYSEPFTAVSDLALLKEEGVLPRNINLKAFEPHRAEFKCAAEADRVPAISSEAQALHDEAQANTSPALWPNQRDYPKAVSLWIKAAQMGNWKSELALLDVAMNGAGIDSEKGKFHIDATSQENAVKRVENLMRLGVPDGFLFMGDFYSKGYGVKQDASRAWALWELAADMGSAQAQTQIGKALYTAEDQPEELLWANEKVAYQMWECAYSQGSAQAAFRLGVDLNLEAQGNRAQNNNPAAQFARARKILHDAVKWGSEDATDYLSSAYYGGAPLVDRMRDDARGDRYTVFSDALYNNSDLRFPNLDAVLPLPPAKLPHWDGNKDKLIEAAKAVRPRQFKQQKNPETGKTSLKPLPDILGGKDGVLRVVVEPSMQTPPQAMPRCKAGEPCPASGIYALLFNESHRQANVQGLRRAWWHQTYMEQGEVMPRLEFIGAATTQAEAKDFEWVLLQAKADMPKLAKDNSVPVPTAETALDPEGPLTAEDYKPGGKAHQGKQS
jgi:hypothetical protein